MLSYTSRVAAFAWLAAGVVEARFLDERDVGCSVTVTESSFVSTVTEFINTATIYATMEAAPTTVYTTISGDCPSASSSSLSSCVATVTQTPNMTTITETVYGTLSYSMIATSNITVYTTVSGSDCVASSSSFSTSSAVSLSSTQAPTSTSDASLLPIPSALGVSNSAASSSISPSDAFSSSPSAIPTSTVTSSSSSISISSACTSVPTLLNPSFENDVLDPWAQLSNFDTGASAPTIIFNTSNPMNGSYYLSQTLYDGTNAMIYQDVSICPSTSYTASFYGLQVGQGKCYIQLCESKNTYSKCGAQVQLPKKGAVAKATLTWTSYKTATAARIEAYVECLGTTPGHVNTVLIDDITFG